MKILKPQTPIGDQIAEARKAAGLTQAELAERAGMAQSLVSRYESGAKSPQRETLFRLADVLGRSVLIDHLGTRLVDPASIEMRSD